MTPKFLNLPIIHLTYDSSGGNLLDHLSDHDMRICVEEIYEGTSLRGNFFPL